MKDAKPATTLDEVARIACAWPDFQNCRIQALPGEIDLNFKLTRQDGTCFVLKIAHPDTSFEALDFQNKLLQHLANQTLFLKFPQVIPDQQGDAIHVLDSQQGKARYVRVLSWVEGRVWGKSAPGGKPVLESLGVAMGTLSSALETFEHPHAHRHLKWDAIKMPWIEPHLGLFPEHQQTMLRHFLSLFKTEVTPHMPQLRHSVIYNDANDYNILLDARSFAPSEVISLIDYGDALHSCTVCDLAIAIAYAVMDKPDPIAAAATIVRGYHLKYALREAEVAVLFPLVAARLCISVTVSALNRAEHPENEYLQISDQPAWSLLEKLYAFSPALAHYTFRHACGWEPCPQRQAFDKWMAQYKAPGRVVLLPAGTSTGWLDLSVGSLDIGHNRNFEDSDRFERVIETLMSEKSIAIGAGGYNEVRPFYTTDSYTTQSNDGPHWRTVHLGLDLWAPAHTAVYSPLAGVVQAVQDNAGERDYGPTLILEHTPEPGLTFYTLYGHLSRDSVAHWKVGMPVEQGARIADIGPRPENGNWPPHLHMQVMLDLLGNSGDYPGVAYPEQREIWTSICPDPAPLAGWDNSPALPDSGLPRRRAERLGSNLSLSYQRPLHIVRGHLQYLYDHEGRRYLDAVNNVPHVGHQHERIVKAGQRQSAVLNTNTRYLHPNIVELAETLLATLPPELEVCYFVNSGSEANELALRMARTATGRQDTLVIEAGYHGNTAACIAVSSYKFDGRGGTGTLPYIHKLPLPDPYRLAEKTVLEGMQAMLGKTPPLAAFIHESILSCGGQLTPPPGYFAEIYQKVKATGGLCIADEVQTGLGRVGSQYWAFQLHGLAPDIVTIGKPLGNGHPIGAVVVRRDVAEAFANGMEYFNTFGGNPVSCAIAREVLAVVRDENLQAN
ncbi:MAG: aminotransferase class III-fold pyridoxal phosphate-dependent enzyme, partial [Saprospiraceae bacterium]|nr:aminotransferase class III-fold pyridoxal phosphate-dependent enzyme [Saprospiraceae bacterium]